MAPFRVISCLMLLRYTLSQINCIALWSSVGSILHGLTWPPHQCTSEGMKMLDQAPSSWLPDGRSWLVNLWLEPFPRATSPSWFILSRLDGGGTSWQRSLHIRLPLWESIIQTYIELITYLGKRRLFTACEVRGLGISMSVLIILVDYFVRAVPVIVQWHLTLQRLCRNWRLAENTWLRGQWWGDRRGLEVIEIQWSSS